MLRFLALREKQRIKGSIRSILDKYMEDNDKIDDAARDELKLVFRSRLTLAASIFGEDLFQLINPDSKSDNKREPSTALFDAVMVAVDRLYAKASVLKERAQAIRESLDAALSVKRNRELVVGKPNTSAAVKQRISVVERVMSKCIK